MDLKKSTLISFKENKEYRKITDGGNNDCISLKHTETHHWSFLSAAANITLEITGLHLKCAKHVDVFREECGECVPYTMCQISEISAKTEQCHFECPYLHSSDVLHVLFKNLFSIQHNVQICSVQQHLSVH